jgi:ankyrin repeat protein
MSRAFPPNPSLEFDRKQAKSLLNAVRSGEADAIQRFNTHHPQHQSAIKNPTLHDAQLVIAREYGLASWRELTKKIQTMELDRFRAALNQGNIEETRQLLSGSRFLVKKINDPLFDFGGRAVQKAAANAALMDVLLEFGADINLRSDWKNGPYTVLDSCSEDAARHYIARGARLTSHAAARLGWIDELRQMLDADAQLIHEKGGDGQRPLHFAKTSAIVDLLLERGAEIDARDVDHHSTAAQYALAKRPEICRHLLSRGAMGDIFMPSRLGDIELARRLIDADPSCLAARTNMPGYAPVPPFNCYCWSLGWYLSPHEVALKFEQQAMYDFLLSKSSAKARFLVACSRGDEAAARALLDANPRLLEQLTPQDQPIMPYSMFYGRAAAAKLMLSLGFDPMARATDGGTLLHVAAWHGNVEIVSLLLKDYRERIDLNLPDREHGSPPLGWACHGSVHSFNKHAGDYPAIVRILVAAGADLHAQGNKYGTSMIQLAQGNEPVQQTLRQLGEK